MIGAAHSSGAAPITREEGTRMTTQMGDIENLDRAATPSEVLQPIKARRRSLTWRERLTPWAFLAVPLTLYGVAVVYPTIATFRLSLFRWDGLSPEVFVGFHNYVALFTTDPVFYRAVLNTLIWIALFLPLSVGTGLVLAVFLNQKIPGRGFLRVLFYLPFVLSAVASGLIWKWMYYPGVGLLDTALPWFGVETPPGWLSDPNIALFSVVVAAIWQATGSSMVLFLAGLQTIPDELYEAGRVSGAGELLLFRYITLPLLRESFVITFSLALIGSLNVFDIVYTMTLGGPANSTQVLGTWMYFQTFQFQNYGGGAAIATILVLVVGIIAIPYISRTARANRD